MTLCCCGDISKLPQITEGQEHVRAHYAQDNLTLSFHVHGVGLLKLNVKTMMYSVLSIHPDF